MAKNVEIDVVELGRVLLVEVHPDGSDAFALEWREEPPALYWCQEWGALLFCDGRPVSSHPSDATTTRQVNGYRRWHDAEPSAASVVRYDVPHPTSSWRNLGTVRRVNYRSTKWGGESQDYTHASRGGSHLFQLGQASSRLFAIRGKMQVTSRGLIK